MIEGKLAYFWCQEMQNALFGRFLKGREQFFLLTINDFEMHIDSCVSTVCKCYTELDGERLVMVFSSRRRARRLPCR